MKNKATIEPAPKRAGRPKRTDKDNTHVPGAERGTLPGEKRRGYIVNIELAEKVDMTAWYDRIKIKDAVNIAFLDYIDKWEKANGRPIKVLKR